MKIFIAGGTGVLGKRIVPLLVDTKHDIHVLARSEKNVELINDMNANPIETDLFDIDDLTDKTNDFDIFIHLATKIPENIEKSKPEDWDMNSKIRIEGTKNLLQAAKEAKAKLYIQQSATFGYGHHGDQILDETVPLKVPVPTVIDIPEGYHRIFNELKEMEDLVNNAYEQDGLPTLIFRFGMFYSHESFIPDIVEGKIPYVFRRNPYVSIINVEDAARAIVEGIEKYEENIGETFNVVDDSDARWREIIAKGSEIANVRKPMTVFGFLVKLLYNRYALNFLCTSTRVSNEKIKSKLDWKPKYPTYEEGFNHEIKKYKELKA